MKTKLLIPKGLRNYIKNRRIYTLCRTIVFFAVSFSLYFAGIKATGDNRNLLTIVAVLGCLPACKSAVNTIMFFRFRGCPEEIAKELQTPYQNLYVLFDIVFTSYDKNYELFHLAMNDKVLCGFTDNKKTDEAACETHLQAMLAKNGIKNVTVKVFRDLTKYKNRLEQLEALTECGAQAEAIRTLMLEISL